MAYTLFLAQMGERDRSMAGTLKGFGGGRPAKSGDVTIKDLRRRAA